MAPLPSDLRELKFKMNNISKNEHNRATFSKSTPPYSAIAYTSTLRSHILVYAAARERRNEVHKAIYLILIKLLAYNYEE